MTKKTVTENETSSTEKFKKLSPTLIFGAGFVLGMILDRTSLLPYIGGITTGIFVCQNYNLPDIKNGLTRLYDYINQQNEEKVE